MIEISGLSGVTLEPIMRSHGWAYLAPLERTEDGFRCPLVLGSGFAVTLQLAASRTGIAIHADHRVTLKQKQELRTVAEHMLSLDFPLHEFQAMRREKTATTLLGLGKKGWGHMLRSPTFWEDAVKTLCTTNASWGYTQKMCRNPCLHVTVHGCRCSVLGSRVSAHRPRRRGSSPRMEARRLEAGKTPENRQPTTEHRERLPGRFRNRNCWRRWRSGWRMGRCFTC